MQPQVDKAPTGAQAPRHIAHDGREILDIGMEEHASRHRHRGIAHRKVAGIRPACGTEPAPCESKLISRDVEPDGAIARVRQNTSVAPGPAGHIKAYLSVASAETFPQE